MFDALPTTASVFINWKWEQIEPYYKALEERPLTDDTVYQWLGDWSALARLIFECFSRLSLAKTLDTTDEAVEAQFNTYLETIYMPFQAAEQRLQLKLLDSGLQPDGMAEPLLKIGADVTVFHPDNLPLRTEEYKLCSEYDRIIGAQTVQWEGADYTLVQLQPIFHTPVRAVRERIWRLKAARQLADREALNALWQKLLPNRLQQASNAGFADYRAHRWQGLHRFAYTPQENKQFLEAIATVVVPAANRIYEKKRQEIGADRLRPWDVDQDYYGLFFPPLTPFTDVTELDAKAATMFKRVDPQLGDYFATMRQEGLLDLPNRKGKAPGGYCTAFPVAKRPFIFMNAVGSARDVTTMLHEAGHAFHVFEISKLPYVPQMYANMEFNEVASMAMELLAAPYLAANEGGFYTEVEAARHRIDHLQRIILFWPYMAVVDSFQHWVYENPETAVDPANCDAQWGELWQRYIPGVDWSDFADEMMTGWQRKQHIYRVPFYYIEYGMAQLGAVQVWANALQDQAGTVAHYRQALALGGTVSLPELYQTAGAKFAFDIPTLREAVALIERTIVELEAVAV